MDAQHCVPCSPRCCQVGDIEWPVVESLALARLPPTVGLSGRPGEAVVAVVLGTGDRISSSAQVGENLFKISQVEPALQQMQLATPLQPRLSRLTDAGCLPSRIRLSDGSQGLEPVSMPSF